MRRHFWAVQAILLGAWEAAAFLTRRRIPTITTTVRRSRSRHRRLTHTIVLAWLVGLARHLLRQEETK